MPKRVKRRKQFRGSMRGKATRGNKISYGEYGIVAMEPGWIKSNQIEAARIAMTRYVKRGGKVWIKIFPDKPVTANKIYNSERWRRLRAMKFAISPLCEMCEKDGRVVPAEDIHHIVSFMDVTDPEQRYLLAYDLNNLMSLCKRHHQAVHNRR